MTSAAVLLRRTLGPLVFLSLAAGVLAAIITSRTPPGVEVALTLTAPSPTRASVRNAAGGTEDTTFEALQSAELFAYTLSGWTTSPEFTAAVYRRAGIPFPRASVRRLSGAFTAVKRGGPVIDVSFRTQSETDGQKLAQALVEEIQTRTAAFTAATGGLRFVVTASDPLVIVVQHSPLVRGLVAALVVGVLGVNLILLKDFLRSPEYLPKS